MKTRNHNLLSFAFLVPISLAIVISVPRFTTWGRRGGGGHKLHQFLRVCVQGQAQKALLEKAEDWVWLFILGGGCWLMVKSIFPPGLVVVDQTENGSISKVRRHLLT